MLRCISAPHPCEALGKDVAGVSECQEHHKRTDDREKSTPHVLPHRSPKTGPSRDHSACPRTPIRSTLRDTSSVSTAFHV